MGSSDSDESSDGVPKHPILQKHEEIIVQALVRTEDGKTTVEPTGAIQGAGLAVVASMDREEVSKVIENSPLTPSRAPSPTDVYAQHSGGVGENSPYFGRYSTVELRPVSSPG